MVRQRHAVESITVVLLAAEEGGCTVEVPQLPGCVTEGDSVEEALANAEEAIAGGLERLAAHGIEGPSGRALVAR